MFSWLFKKEKCKHLSVRELMSCDAVCRDCDKNLGFIQTWRDTIGQHPDASEQPNDPSNPACWKQN